MKKIDEKQLELQKECRRIMDNRIKCNVLYKETELVSNVYIYKVFDSTNMCDDSENGIIVSLEDEGTRTCMFIAFEKINAITTIENE